MGQKAFGRQAEAWSSAGALGAYGARIGDRASREGQGAGASRTIAAAARRSPGRMRRRRWRIRRPWRPWAEAPRG